MKHPSLDRQFNATAFFDAGSYRPNEIALVLQRLMQIGRHDVVAVVAQQESEVDYALRCEAEYHPKQLGTILVCRFEEHAEKLEEANEMTADDGLLRIPKWPIPNAHTCKKTDESARLAQQVEGKPEEVRLSGKAGDDRVVYIDAVDVCHGRFN
jgi:hypothetical protein